MFDRKFLGMKNKLRLLIVLFFIITIGQIIGSLGNFFDVSGNEISSDIIVSLGGDNGTRIKKTLNLYDKNMSRSNKVILTGVDDFDPTMKIYELDWRANYLEKKGIKKG